MLSLDKDNTVCCVIFYFFILWKKIISNVNVKVYGSILVNGLVLI